MLGLLACAVCCLTSLPRPLAPPLPHPAASLMHTYLDLPAAETQRRIAWNANDPNLLQMGLPGGLQVHRLGWRARVGQSGVGRGRLLPCTGGLVRQGFLHACMLMAAPAASAEPATQPAGAAALSGPCRCPKRPPAAPTATGVHTRDAAVAGVAGRRPAVHF